MKAIKNIMMYDFDHFILNGYIIFNEKIIEIGSMKTFDFDGETIDGQDCLLLPGLINSHTHLYSTLFRGLNLKVAPHNFKGILDAIWWPFDQALDLESIAYSATVYGEESLKSGVTALIDHHASGEIIGSLEAISSALKKIGTKHLLCFETSDRFDLDQCVHENKYAVDHRGYFGLHASMSLSDASLIKIKKDIGGSPIHIHVAESPLDQVDALKQHQMRVVNRLDRFKILNEDSILAHCLHIDDHEGKLISEKKCYIALNPTSNFNNAVGLYKYDLIKKHKIKVLVGTDGLGVNVAKEWQNLYYVGKASVSDPSGVELKWIQESIINAYHNFNKRSGCKIGLIKKGYSSDFILVAYKSPTAITEANIFSHVFFSVFDGLKPRAVYIDGHKKVSNYQLTHGSTYDLNVAEKLWKRIGGSK